MKKILHIAAQVLSALLYPLFIPTYGALLVCIAFSLQAGTPLPALYWLALVGVTALLTLLLPLLIILLMVRRKTVDDIYLRDAQQRTVPYVYTTVCYGCWTYYLWQLPFPRFLFFTAIGATAALFVVMLVNVHWKISAHLTAWSGLMGGIANYWLWAGILPEVGTVCTLCLIALLLMYARIGLDAHTPQQTVAGLLLGLSFTTLPYIITTSLPA